MDDRDGNRGIRTAMWRGLLCFLAGALGCASQTRPDAGLWPEAPVSDTAAYEVQAVDKPVLSIHQAKPKYPRDLQLRGQCGYVDVQYIVSASGQAERESITILNATHPGFQAPAVDAVGLSRFSAAQKDGRPVRQIVRQRIGFSLKSRCRPAEPE